MLPYVIDTFEFRVLRQNRRVVSGGDGEEDRSEELEGFHRVLTDISWGCCSQEVRAFIVNAYVRGSKINCAENTGFESNTAVFTKRRYRDRFNRKMLKRIGAECHHQLKIKARVRPKGTRSSSNWRPRLETSATLTHADCNAMGGVLVCGSALRVTFYHQVRREPGEGLAFEVPLPVPLESHACRRFPSGV